MAKLARHPMREDAPIETSLNFAITMAEELRSDLNRWRLEVVKEMQQRVLDMKEELEAWYKDLPAHGKDAYRSPGAVAECVAWPALKELGTLVNYPGIDEIFQETTGGFRLMGGIAKGQGWRPLKPDRIQEGLSWKDLRLENAEVMRTCAEERPGKQSGELLKEILDERRLGRMWGPFEAPQEFGFKAAALPPEWAEEQDKRTPLWKIQRNQEPIGAPAFSITQTDADGSILETRRGDDWIRSKQNEAATVSDKPGCHHIDYLVDGASELKRRDPSKKLTVWGHDHDGAYRQLLTENPFWTMCLLATTFGPTVWAHTVLPFGSKAAVWAYGRVADFLCHLARVCLFSAVWHYVDDFTGVEDYRTSESAFQSFRMMNEAHGLKTKGKKEQRPQRNLWVQGVLLQMGENNMKVAPLEDRRRRLVE